MSTANRRRSSQDVSSNDLKLRIKELEEEVRTLKRRLDELRKAKNTTVLKREREVLEVGVPFKPRDSKTQGGEDERTIQDLRKQLAQMKSDRQNELSEIRTTFAIEVDALKKQKDTSCDHDIELNELKSRLSDMEADCAALVVENTEQKDLIKTLERELSMKEAKWCETEEKYKLELKTSWGTKYAEWMSSTERKIQDLQATNEILRGYLKKQSPSGRDPSGQDS